MGKSPRRGRLPPPSCIDACDGVCVIGMKLKDGQEFGIFAALNAVGRWCVGREMDGIAVHEVKGGFWGEGNGRKMGQSLFRRDHERCEVVLSEDVVEGMRLFDVKSTGLRSSESAHVGACAEFLSQIAGDRTDIGAAAACNGKRNDGALRKVTVREFRVIKGDFAGFKNDRFPLCSEFVGAFSLDVEGGKIGGNLLDRSAKGGERVFDVCLCEMLPGGFFERFAGGIVCRGGSAEAEVGEVVFVAAEEEFEEACGATDGGDEEAGGFWVKGAAMTDLLCASCEMKTTVDLFQDRKG